MYGWRRNLDITTIAICTVYHCLRAFETLNLYFYGFIFLGMGCYVLSQQLSQNGMFRVLSKYAHSGMHVSGNIANLFLYKDLYRVRDDTLALCEIALINLIILALLDGIFIGGWPPKWWPKEDVF